VVPPKGYQARQGDYNLSGITIATPIKQHVSSIFESLQTQVKFCQKLTPYHLHLTLSAGIRQKRRFYVFTRRAETHVGTSI
jgi:hypothetical protein